MVLLLYKFGQTWDALTIWNLRLNIILSRLLSFYLSVRHYHYVVSKTCALLLPSFLLITSLDRIHVFTSNTKSSEFTRLRRSNEVQSKKKKLWPIIRLIIDLVLYSIYYIWFILSDAHVYQDSNIKNFDQ